MNTTSDNIKRRKNIALDVSKVHKLCIYSHDVKRVPVDGVGVEIRGGIEPEMELHLAVTFTSSEDIGVDSVRLSCEISQKLEVNLIPCRSFG